MKRIRQLTVFLIGVLPATGLLGGDPAKYDSPHLRAFGHFAPAGGWNPGGGLLHWWPKCCFPQCGACDDYCRKPLPYVCGPVYSHYYTFGPPEICQCGCGAAVGKGAVAPVK
jgi:hypothetical protein